MVKGQKNYLKRQVDDFAVAAANAEVAHKVFDDINDGLSMPMKRQGLITLFNGMDILQSRYFMKMSVQTYIEKMATNYAGKWDKELEQMGKKPLPILKLKDGTPNPEYQDQMRKAFGFGCRNGVGEIIYAMVTCRHDISTSTVGCAQNSACPHEVHYTGVKHILKYLWCTRNDGIYFWRQTPLLDPLDHHTTWDPRQRGHNMDCWRHICLLTLIGPHA
jgi:hypothetical protein